MDNTKRLFLLNLIEKNALYGEEPSTLQIVVESDLDETEIKKIMEKVGEIKSHESFEDIEWSEAICKILKNHFADKITILGTEAEFRLHFGMLDKSED